MARTWTMQFLQYVTAILLIVLLSFHLAERIPWITGVSYHESLKSERVADAYSSYGWALLLLAYAALFHGLNGFRGMLHEWKPRHGRLWDLVFIILFLVFAGIATYTVVGLPPLP